MQKLLDDPNNVMTKRSFDLIHFVKAFKLILSEDTYRGKSILRSPVRRRERNPRDQKPALAKEAAQKEFVSCAGAHLLISV